MQLVSSEDMSASQMEDMALKLDDLLGICSISSGITSSLSGFNICGVSDPDKSVDPGGTVESCV